MDDSKEAGWIYGWMNEWMDGRKKTKNDKTWTDRRGQNRLGHVEKLGVG